MALATILPWSATVTSLNSWVFAWHCYLSASLLPTVCPTLMVVGYRDELTYLSCGPLSRLKLWNISFSIPETTIRLQILGGGVKQKATLQDKGGRRGKAKSVQYAVFIVTIPLLQSTNWSPRCLHGHWTLTETFPCTQTNYFIKEINMNINNLVVITSFPCQQFLRHCQCSVSLNSI